MGTNTMKQSVVESQISEKNENENKQTNRHLPRIKNTKFFVCGDSGTIPGFEILTFIVAVMIF